MAIGQITISAADWLAARVTDRLAITVAASRMEDATALGGSSAVPASQEDGKSQLDQRRQQRSILAAQESYRRVAARIKSRLASQAEAEQAQPGRTSEDATGRAGFIDSLKDNPKLAATLIAEDARGHDAGHADRAAQRHEDTSAPANAVRETGFEATGTREDDDAKRAAAEASDPVSAWEAAEARADAIAADAVFRTGLWADLFENADAPTDHLPVVED